MRNWMTAATIVWLTLAAAPSPASAAACPIGANVTIRGTLTRAPFETDSSAWVIRPSQQTRTTSCSLDVLRGKDEVPPGCGPGKRFTASGHVYVAEGLLLEMLVTGMRCF